MARLEKDGANRDRVVGLCVQKSAEEVLGMVAIMRSGAAYVPLDPKLPTERLRYLVQQCDCATVATQLVHVEVRSRISPVP